MEITERIASPDGITVKYLQTVSGGISVETTYVNRPEKHIICFSSQVGCAVGCKFCSSGIVSRFKRSLTKSEIVNQCANVLAEIDFMTSPKPLLLSCMGEGEPFLNFDAVVDSFRALSATPLGPTPIRLAVSTSGIRPDLIRKLGGIEFSVPLKIQVSLHGATDEVRRKIVPVTAPLAKIIPAVRDYLQQCNRAVDWNYVMCKGINDSPAHAQQLAGLLEQGWHVKFNRLNRATNSSFLPAPRERVEEFRRILEEGGISTEYYETDGADIAASCGQLSYRFNEKH
ncbi:MAG: radical SAM protein [bacterium]|nr:radical SAM protein [bacterium]